MAQYPVALQQLGQGPCLGLRVLGTRHHRHFIAEQRFGLQALQHLAGADAADRQVQTAFAQPRVGQGGKAVDKFQPDMWQRLSESRHHRCQQRLPDPGRNAHRQAAFHAALAVALQALLGARDLADDASGLLQQFRAGRCELHAASPALEQGHADAGL
ncbi:hypothetical protein D3C71_1698430 [compost metagenome]